MSVKTVSKESPTALVPESKIFYIDGILNDRQKTWMAGANNDIDRGKSNLYKPQNEEKARKIKLTLKSSDLINVRGLTSEIIVAENNTGGIIDKIQESRRERHESAFEDMVQELGAISLDIAPQVKDICETIKTYLDDDLKDIQTTMSTLLHDDSLISHSRQSLKELWTKVSNHSIQREAWVQQLNDTLQNIEQNRSELITQVVASFGTLFVQIAHLMSSDVHRMMEDEVMKINKSLLANQVAYADLIKRLMLNDVEREKKNYHFWKSRVEDWKALKLEESVKKFQTYMVSEAVVSSPVVKRHLNDLVNEQVALNNRRLSLLNQLIEMKPPSSTKTAVYQWNQAVTEVTYRLDEVHEKYISLLKTEHETILYDCGECITRTVDQLINEGVVEQSNLEQLVHEFFYPLLGEQKATFDYDIEKIEKHLHEVAAYQKQNLKVLFKYALGAAHVWDDHELGLIRQEKALQEYLDKNRKDHDYQNQIKEAKLDIVMDRMRQESTSEALSLSLKVALQMLDEIKKSYYEFHNLQKNTCKKYPNMVSTEVARFASAICAYFNVQKYTAEKNRSGSKLKIMDTISLASGAKFDILENESQAGGPIASFLVDIQKSASSMAENDLTPSSYQIEDLETEAFEFIDSFAIPEVMFTTLKNHMRNEFLEHLEFWKSDCVQKAETIMMTKIEEINNELDLRLHLHEPRPKRTEKDVYGVRAGELTLHRDRVEQHCVGIQEALTLTRSSYQEMLSDHIKENDTFRASVEELEASFRNASNTNELKGMQGEVSGKLDQHMEVIRSSVRRFRYNLDEMLNKFRNSNAEFRQSLKLFSEGGNYSPDEVEEFRKRLEKVATRIDNCEGQIMGELEGLETKRMEIAKEYTGRIEERFKHHLFDLTFIEKIKRWLTNIQVKIKGEVANSNSESQHLSKMISVFNRRLDNIKNPSVDHESCSITELHETLLPLFNALHERIAYLDCGTVKEFAYVPTSNEQQISEIVKKEVKCKEKLPARGRFKKLAKKSERIQLKRNSPGHGSNRPLSQTTFHDEKTDPDPADDFNEFLDSKPHSGGGGHDAVRGLAGKYDRKYYVFGELKPGTAPDNNFTSLQLHVLRVGLDGVLSTAEYFYRHKGQRTITRPQLMSETFETCAEHLIQRLRKYKDQTETYRNACIQEFRAQVKLFSDTVLQFPNLFLKNILSQNLSKYHSRCDEIGIRLKLNREESEKLRRKNQTLLRPTLGHPNNKEELNKLSAAETSRQKFMEEMILSYENEMDKCLTMCLKDFCVDLQETVVTLLSEFDSIVTLDDVREVVVRKEAKSEKQLIKEKLIGIENENKSECTDVMMSPCTLPGISLKKFENNPVLKDIVSDIIVPVTSKKKTNAHDEICKARDNVFEVYFAEYQTNLSALKTRCGQLRKDDKRWIINWVTSIKKVVELY